MGALVLGLLVVGLLCSCGPLVDADREWYPGEERIIPAREVSSDYSDTEDLPSSVRDHSLTQLQNWLRSRELAASLQYTAEQAAVAAARADGEYAAAAAPQRPLHPDESFGKEIDAKSEDSGNENSDAEDFTFAIGPGDPRFEENEAKIDGPVEKLGKLENEMDIDIDGESHEVEDGPRIMPVILNPMDHSVAPMTFIVIVAACCSALVAVIILIGVCTYRLQKKAKAAADVEYPAYGVTGPSKDLSPGSADRRMAQSAQMYHYQHQKQQIIAMERASNERRGSASEPESEDENEEGDYTVYECPGLASTREMEVKNPLFLDEDATASPVPVPSPQPQMPKELPN